MSNLTCPKCGGSDSFISQRNIVKGAGVFMRGKMRSVAVCKVCDEIMSLPETIGTTTPISKLSASEARRFYFPHLILAAISLPLSFLSTPTLNVIGVTLIQINIVVLVIRVVARYRRSRGIY
jgi:hypothetical protein